MTDRTAIVGLGPVGGILAAHLVRAGREVTVIDTYQAHLDRIRRDGLVVEGRTDIRVPMERCRDSVIKAAAIGERFDTVHLCVKSSVIASVAPGLPAILEEDGVVIGWHNGIDTEEPLAAAVGRRRVLRGVTNYAGELAAPGRLVMTFFNPPNHLGALDPGDGALEARAREIAARISGAGLDTAFSPDVRRHVWEKAIRNVVLGPVSALTGLDMAEVLGSAEGRALVEALLAEAMAVSDKAGYRFPDAFFAETIGYLERAGQHVPSMLRDVRAGRRTEIAHQNRKIVEYGERHGVPTPNHRVIAKLVECIDSAAGDSGANREKAGRNA